jgi:hypothetical protein
MLENMMMLETMAMEKEGLFRSTSWQIIIRAVLLTVSAGGRVTNGVLDAALVRMSAEAEEAAPGVLDAAGAAAVGRVGEPPELAGVAE